MLWGQGAGSLLLLSVRLVRSFQLPRPKVALHAAAIMWWDEWTVNAARQAKLSRLPRRHRKVEEMASWIAIVMWCGDAPSATSRPRDCAVAPAVFRCASCACQLGSRSGPQSAPERNAVSSRFSRTRKVWTRAVASKSHPHPMTALAPQATHGDFASR